MPILTDDRPGPEMQTRRGPLPVALQLLAVVAGLAALPALILLAGKAFEAGSVAALVFLLVAATLLSWFLWSVNRLGRLIRRGEALSPQAATALTHISLATLALGALRSLGGAWLAGVLALDAPRLSGPPGVPDLMLLLLCGVVLCAARAMSDAAMLSDDQAHIV
ncbi:MAG: hypothetical protein ACK40I_01305 [Tabrizicola sp.]